MKDLFKNKTKNVFGNQSKTLFGGGQKNLFGYTTKFFKMKSKQHMSKWNIEKQNNIEGDFQMEEQTLRVHKEILRGVRGPRKSKLQLRSSARLSREDRRAEQGPRHGAKGVR